MVKIGRLAAMHMWTNNKVDTTCEVLGPVRPAAVAPKRTFFKEQAARIAFLAAGIPLQL